MSRQPVYTLTRAYNAYMRVLYIYAAPQSLCPVLFFHACAARARETWKVSGRDERSVDRPMNYNARCSWRERASWRCGLFYICIVARVCWKICEVLRCGLYMVLYNKRATFNEKHHLACLSRGLRHALVSLAKRYLAVLLPFALHNAHLPIRCLHLLPTLYIAYTLLSYLRIRQLLTFSAFQFILSRKVGSI